MPFCFNTSASAVPCNTRKSDSGQFMSMSSRQRSKYVSLMRRIFSLQRGIFAVQTIKLTIRNYYWMERRLSVNDDGQITVTNWLAFETFATTWARIEWQRSTAYGSNYISTICTCRLWFQMGISKFFFVFLFEPIEIKVSKRCILFAYGDERRKRELWYLSVGAVRFPTFIWCSPSGIDDGSFFSMF